MRSNILEEINWKVMDILMYRFVFRQLCTLLSRGANRLRKGLELVQFDTVNKGIVL